ncbi:MAG: SDR family oxidoreductase [Hyphomicrobiaceae bacterium]
MDKKFFKGLKRARPLKRLGRPGDVAGLVTFLASDNAEFMTG